MRPMLVVVPVVLSMSLIVLDATGVLRTILCRMPDPLFTWVVVAVEIYVYDSAMRT